MSNLARAMLAATALVGVAAARATVAPPAPERAPERVTIAHYAGDAMEPFVAPDGRALYFNTRNAPGDTTQLHWAGRDAAGTFAHRGLVAGANAGSLTGVPSIDRAGDLYFVSPRDYDRTLCTIYVAHVRGGVARDVRPVRGLASPRRGIVRFDADISGDGRRLLLSEGTFDFFGGPHTARLLLARGQGDHFRVDPDSDRIFAATADAGLNYAGTLTSDERTLYFTRALPGSPPQIFVAVRPRRDVPFGAPSRIDGLGDFVEAPALDERDHRLYYHRRIGAGHFAVFSVLLPR